MKTFQNPKVAEVFRNYPPDLRKKLMTLRQLIFDTAAKTEGVGKLEETLKWGEPAYLTLQSKSGTTIRLNPKKDDPTQYALYFNCQTHLIETFRTMFPGRFTYEGNRALVFKVEEKIPVKEIRFCIAAALTYHLHRKTVRK